MNPKSNCREVEQAVFGIREAEELHWVHAFGIVDNDRRSNEELKRLEAKGVYTLPIFSVESLYYHPYVQKRVAEKHAEITEESAAVTVPQAKEAAISEIRRQSRHLCERVAEKLVRKEFFDNLPIRKDIGSQTSIEISIDVASILQKEENCLDALIEAKNLEKIVEQYPIRETGALGAIARALGFNKPSQYQGAVRKLLMQDTEALSFVRTFFAPLEGDINTV